MFGYRRLVRKRVLVNLKSGKAVGGILYSKRGPLLVIREPVLHEGRTTTPMDGEFIVERANVDFIQHVWKAAP